MMGVNRSGYYKWVGRKGALNRYEQDRIILTELLKGVHQRHKSYGYHRLAWWVRQETGWVFSDNLAHKCCKAAGIHSAARRPVYHRPGQENIVYGNLVNGNWNASRPLELVVSDMTCFSHKGQRFEWTLLVDTYNNEILAHSLSDRPGNNLPYYSCLEVLAERVAKKTVQSPSTILHTDQGASTPHRRSLLLMNHTILFAQCHG